MLLKLTLAEELQLLLVGEGLLTYPSWELDWATRAEFRRVALKDSVAEQPGLVAVTVREAQHSEETFDT
jgi:hypothetical protein